MSVRMKYGSFRITKLVFPDKESLNEYLDYFAFKSYVIKKNGKEVKKEGPLGLILSREQRKNFNWLKINMDIDPEENEITMNGYGHRQGIFSLEIELDRMYEADKLVSYIRDDTCARINDDVDWSSEIEDKKREWAADQNRRIELFKQGKTIKEIKDQIEQEKQLIKTR